jgi:hypothetical protein
MRGGGNEMIMKMGMHEWLGKVFYGSGSGFAFHYDTMYLGKVI